MDIKNMPDYAMSARYIVYRLVDGENWFYGAYDDLNRAAMAAGGLSNGKIWEVEHA